MTKDTEALREAAKVLRKRCDRVKFGQVGFYGSEAASFDSKVAYMLDALATPDTIGSHFGNGGEFDPESAVAPVAYRYVHRNYAGQKINIYGDHPVRVNGALPEETHPLYAHPPHPVPVDPVAGWEALRDALVSAACDGIADDYMTSEKHHPGYVLIPSAKFEAILAALKGPAA